MTLTHAGFDPNAFHTLLLQPLGDSIMQVTLNRPRAHNAYNAQMVSELAQVLAFTEQTPAIRVVILTGAGENTFCAGADLKEAFIDGGKGLVNQHGGYNPLQHMPRRKVWIAALNGNALGGGLELALHCDLLVSVDDATLTLPETRHSLLPIGGGITRLSALLPAPMVKEIILAGGELEASRAFSLGLINRLCDRQRLLAVARELAEQVTRQAPLAVQAANALIEHALHGEPATLAAHAQRELGLLQRSEDFAESGLAWKEKRQPVWKGR